MNNQEVQLILMNITLILGAILLLLFIFRVIRVLTKNKVESKEDAHTMLFIIVLMCIVGYCAYKIKSAFKKEDKHPVV